MIWRCVNMSLLYNIYYIFNNVEHLLATLKVALQNILCVAQRERLQNLLQYFCDKMNSNEGHRFTILSYC